MAERAQTSLNNPSLRSRLRQTGTRTMFATPVRQRKHPVQHEVSQHTEQTAAAQQPTESFFQPYQYTHGVQENQPDIQTQPDVPAPVYQHAPVPQSRLPSIAGSEIIGELATPPITKHVAQEKPHVYLRPAKGENSALETPTITEPRLTTEFPTHQEIYVDEQMPITTPEPVHPAIVQEPSPIVAEVPHYASQPIAMSRKRPQQSTRISRIMSFRPSLRGNRLQMASFTGAFIILLLGGFTTFQSLRSNQDSAAKIAGISNNSGSIAAGTAVGPSILKPSIAAISNYQTGLNKPKFLNIPALSIHARVQPIATSISDPSGYPSDIYDAGWYDQSSLPGDTGALILSGHTQFNGSNGLFHDIQNLKPGDKIQIIRGDEVSFNYQVVRSTVYTNGNVNMQTALGAVDPVSQGLNIVSAPNEGLPGVKGSKAQIVVFAVQL